VIDFNDPTRPFEATFFDAGNGAVGGSDNWAAYWYEGPGTGRRSLTMYGQDGVEDPPSGLGFQVLSARTDVRDIPLPFLNPQTQMNVLRSHRGPHHGKADDRQGQLDSGSRQEPADSSAELRRSAASAAARRLAP
jgi:hypothetical protein